MKKKVANAIDAFAPIGNSILCFIAYLKGLSLLTYHTLFAMSTLRRKGLRATRTVIVDQTFFTGVQALPLVAGIALLVGVIIIIQATTTMPKLGASDFLGKIFVLVIIRELGPLLTSVIVIGRSGSALASYVGYMKVNQEVEALEVMGIDPIEFLVLPAMLGALIAMACLTFFFDAVAIVFGYLALFIGKILGMTAFTFELPIREFLSKIINALAIRDIVISVIKAVIFAITISVVACYHGLNLKYSFNEIPKATLTAVVHSLVITMLFNTLVTVLSYTYVH